MRSTKSSNDPFDRILTALHNAALDETRWPDADRLIGEINGTSGSCALLYSATSAAEMTGFLMRICVDGRRRKDWERRYAEEYWAGDERAPRIVRLEYGRITPTENLYTDAEKKTSPTYNEALTAVKAQHGLNMRLEGAGGMDFIWIVCDPVERGGWRSDQIELVRRLQPHVRQSAVVSHALAEARLTGATAMDFLANRRIGIVYLDRRCRIAATNDRALEILRRGDGLMDRAGSLCAVTPEKNAKLSRLLAHALPPFGVQGFAGSMTVSRRLALHVTPLGDDYPHFRTRRFGAMVIIVDPAGRSWVDPAGVAAILELTLAESRLAVALAAGQTVGDIAAATGRAEETVRWHLKQIYRKLGISRQVDLVRRVLSLDGFGPVSRDR